MVREDRHDARAGAEGGHDRGGRAARDGEESRGRRARIPCRHRRRGRRPARRHHRRLEAGARPLGDEGGAGRGRQDNENGRDELKEGARMGRRLLASFVVMLVAAPSLSLAGQATGWRPPRTPDGQPDLQGFWTNATYTPLERPKDVTKAFYTKEEAAELEKRLAAADAAQTEPGTIEDVHYDFTQFGLDTHQAPYASNQRTSMIVDPPRSEERRV